MCGIAGWINSKQTGFDTAQVADSVKKAMYHRGPDLQKDMHWPGITLIHNRLKIIDLSELGSQPMKNEDGSVWIVFNGEIYNHLSLRKMLEAKGHVFASHSDTEVIVHLYEEYGATFVQHLRGMFAICLYDVKRNKALFARDRFGIKPLFYYKKDDQFLAFASELNAIKAIPGLDLEIDKQSIYDYTALFYIPAPHTFYKHIHALMPGELMEIDITGTTLQSSQHRYYRHLPKPATTNGEQTIQETSELIENAVSRQLESDVALGSLLSGGIDSSLVSFYAQKNMRTPLHTYNVKFSDESYDESWAAIAVAEQIQSDHQTLYMAERSAGWEHVTGLLKHAGQPFADTSYFAVQGVCALMKKYVTVALSGDGGDEAFGGYSTYNEIEQIYKFNNIPKLFTMPLVGGVKLAGGLHSKFSRYGRILDSFYNKDIVHVVENMYRWMRRQEHDKLWHKKTSGYAPVRRFIEADHEQLKPLKLQGLEELSALTTLSNTNLVLPNDFLFKVDTASMHESLEIRVPMLDEDLFEKGLSLPHRMKTNNKELKYVLRGVAKKVLPEKVANKPKWGFGIPIDNWVTADFKQQAATYLLDSNNAIREILNPEVYTEWVDCFCNNKQHPEISREGLYQRLIMLLTLSLHLN